MRLLLLAMFLMGIHVSDLLAQRNFTFNQGYMDMEQYYESIPFEFVMDKIIVEAKVNGRKGRFILDTGAMCILFKKPEQPKDYEVLRTMNVKDANNKSKQADVVKLEHIQLGNLSYFDVPALYVNEFGGALKCFEVDGLIGSNLLRLGAIKVDIENKELILADSFQDFKLQAGQGIKMKCNKIQSSPFIHLKLNGVKQKDILIDTGSGGIYAFGEQVCEKMKRKKQFDEPAFVSSGTNSQGAWGVDGREQYTYIWRIKDLEINGSVFSNCLLRSDRSSSRIGMGLLHQGEFVLDYPQERFFFIPSSKKKQSLVIRSFGVDLASVNDSLKVTGIWAGTEAEKGGLQKGDVLLDVVELNFVDHSLCNLFLQLRQEAKTFQTLEFVFRKHDSTEEFNLKLIRIE